MLLSADTRIFAKSDDMTAGFPTDDVKFSIQRRNRESLFIHTVSRYRLLKSSLQMAEQNYHDLDNMIDYSFRITSSRRNHCLFVVCFTFFRYKRCFAGGPMEGTAIYTRNISVGVAALNYVLRVKSKGSIKRKPVRLLSLSFLNLSCDPTPVLPGSRTFQTASTTVSTDLSYAYSLRASTDAFRRPRLWSTNGSPRLFPQWFALWLFSSRLPSLPGLLYATFRTPAL